MSDKELVCPRCKNSVADSDDNVTIEISSTRGALIRCSSCGAEFSFADESEGAVDDRVDVVPEEDAADEEESDEYNEEHYESADESKIKGWYILPGILAFLIIVYLLLIVLGVIPNPF